MESIKISYSLIPVNAQTCR